MPLIRPGIRKLFRLKAAPSERPAEVDEEIAFHLDRRVEQLQRAGLSAAHARAEALRLFGDTTLAHTDLHESARRRDRQMTMSEQFSSVAQDARYAVRGLLRDRGFTAFVALTLGLGIGVNAAMYGVVDRLLLRGPDHVRDANNVLRLYTTKTSADLTPITSGRFGYVAYNALRQNAKHFRVAAYRVNTEQLTFGSGLGGERWSRGDATADLFVVLGVTPLLGRFFTEAEDNTTSPAPVVVLGYGVWVREFNADTAIVGKSITLGDQRYTVIGIAKRGFTGPELGRVDAWMPMSLASRTVTSNWTTAWTARWLSIVARVAPGSSYEQASAEATTVIHNAYIGTDHAQAAAVHSFRPISYDMQGAEPVEFAVARWLIGVCVIVLLVACANVANLLLARVVRRQREIAVRLALGISRARLMRLFLVEALLLSGIGAFAGLLVTYVSGAFMRVVLLPDVEWTTSPVNTRIVAVSAFISLLVALVIGMLPAWRASRPSLTEALKSGAREGGAQKTNTRIALTVAQAGLSVVLLVGAGLFVQSLLRVRALDLGIQPDRVLVVRVSWPQPGIEDRQARMNARIREKAFYASLLDSVRHMPNVERASLSVGLPFSGSFSVTLRVPGWDSLPSGAGGDPGISAITSDYFETTGGRIIRGRGFSTVDRAGTELVTVVSQTMAKTYWPNTDPIGTCLYSGDGPDAPCARIVGISNDARRARLTETPSMHYYVPLGQEIGIGGTNLLVRPHRKPADIVAPLRKLAQSIDPTVSFVEAKLLQQRIDPQIRGWRLGANVFALMGVLALFVAAIGLYSVMSYFVAQRRHEWGVRMALGATGRDILRLIFRNGMATAMAGVALGVIAALLGGRFIQPLLFQTSAKDARVFSAVVVMLLFTASVASLVPALRAGRVNPMDALRSD